MKITLNKKTLTEKTAKAEELACVDSGENKCKKQGKYLAILSYGNGEYGIAALTRMGLIYRSVANEIRNAPLPKNLDEDQMDIYRAELDNFALGPEEKALEAFENATAKAYELNVYNKWLLLAQDNIKELNQNKYPDLQTPGFRGADFFITASIENKGQQKAAAPEEKGAPSDAKDGDKDDEGGDDEDKDNKEAPKAGKKPTTAQK
jgi:hypothetical protein